MVHRPRSLRGEELSWHGAEVAWGTRADATRHARPRGRAARGPREAQVARTRGRRPRGQVHVDAREGRHMAGGLAGEVMENYFET